MNDDEVERQSAMRAKAMMAKVTGAKGMMDKNTIAGPVDAPPFNPDDFKISKLPPAIIKYNPLRDSVADIESVTNENKLLREKISKAKIYFSEILGDAKSIDYGDYRNLIIETCEEALREIE